MIRLREQLIRHRRRALALGAIAALALLLVLAHSAPDEREMGGDEMGAVISVCLAVLQGASALAFGLGAIGFSQRRPCTVATPAAFAAPPPHRHWGPARPRAGPLFQVFLN